MLGAGIDHDIGPQLQRLLQQRRGEDIVHHDDRARGVGQFGHRRQIDQFQHRVGWRFQQHEAGRPGQCRLPLAKVRAIDEYGLDAELRQQGRDDPVAGSEQGPRCHHPVAGLQVRQQRGIDGGHAGGRGAAVLGAFNQAKPLFQHRQRRIGKAGILIMLNRAGKGRLGLFGIVVDIARGQKQRFGGFAMMGALDAAMHEAGGGTKLGWIECHLSGPLLAMARPLSSWGPKTTRSLASLARLFHLAAIRPDKSRGPGHSRRLID